MQGNNLDMSTGIWSILDGVGIADGCKRLDMGATNQPSVRAISILSQSCVLYIILCGTLLYD